MISNSSSCSLAWDFVIDRALDKSQGWVLCTMQKYGSELVTMLWRILGNEQDVCDAYQDTFLKLAHYENNRKPEHVKAYVFRSASNTAVSMLRRRAIEKRKLAEISTEEKSFQSAEKELDVKLMRESLRYYITKLPDHLRDVVTLRDLAELSYFQVARILGIAETTARVYRCKAVQLLSAWMTKNSGAI
ncbi:MAG: sigma-70 family RNA polymerase sigma factor [Planctomycetes bacterium]|nr:sigma-70 family RNA polymerase sigma factor [Planctomycetota bacterium]